MWLPVVGGNGSKQREQMCIRDREIGYKVSATLMAVLPALYLAIREQNRVSLLIAAGTLCCMAADALLEVQFVTGAAVFAAAHLFFIAGMLLSLIHI